MHAIVVAVGRRCETSRERFGPDMTATCDGSTSVTSLLTSLMRLHVPGSISFMKLTSGASSGIKSFCAIKFLRRVCDGIARMS